MIKYSGAQRLRRFSIIDFGRKFEDRWIDLLDNRPNIVRWLRMANLNEKKHGAGCVITFHLTTPRRWKPFIRGLELFDEAEIRRLDAKRLFGGYLDRRTQKEAGTPWNPGRKGIKRK